MVDPVNASTAIALIDIGVSRLVLANTLADTIADGFFEDPARTFDHVEDLLLGMTAISRGGKMLMRRTLENDPEVLQRSIPAQIDDLTLLDSHPRLIGTTLKTLRNELMLTIQALADKLGMSKGFISQVENGHNTPCADTILFRVDQALELPPGTFVGCIYATQAKLSAIKERAGDSPA